MPSLAAAVAAALGCAVARVTPVTGGCISDAGRVDLTDGRTVFAKSAAGLPPGCSRSRPRGCAGWARSRAFPSRRSRRSRPTHWCWRGCRRGRPGPAPTPRWAARWRRCTGPRLPAFGWHRDGFIGREPQRNTPTSSAWPEFWFDRRIGPLVDRAVGRGALDPRARDLAERLRAGLADRAGPAEPAVRVHGDLWSGNVHVDTGGQPWLVDPAPYGGHREVDLAMLHLFGRPGPGCVAAYQEVRPLADGWRDRMELWQLEPLLNHAVMFGGGYGSSALAVLGRRC